MRAVLSMMMLGVIAFGGLGLSVTGCGTASNPAPATTAAASTTVATASAATSSTTDELITVPDVSGMNHQQAQDTMQAAGLFNLREVDGKGLGRALVVDRNWVQVAQDPPAGSRVPPDTVITLTAVKYTDR